MSEQLRINLHETIIPQYEFSSDVDILTIDEYQCTDGETGEEFFVSEELRRYNQVAFEGLFSNEERVRGFVRYNGDTATGTVMTYTRTPQGWKRTNALSDDETFDVVFAGFRNPAPED